MFQAFYLSDIAVDSKCINCFVLLRPSSLLTMVTPTRLARMLHTILCDIGRIPSDMNRRFNEHAPANRPGRRGCGIFRV